MRKTIATALLLLVAYFIIKPVNVNLPIETSCTKCLTTYATVPVEVVPTDAKYSEVLPIQVENSTESKLADSESESISTESDTENVSERNESETESESSENESDTETVSSEVESGTDPVIVENEAESESEENNTEYEDDSTSVIETEENQNDGFIVNLSQQELEDFYKLVYAEDGIESEEYQVAVAATILNRILSDSFPDDFYGVICQENAFSTVHGGKIYMMTSEPYEVTLDMIPESTISAVQRALRGEDPTEEALIAESRRLGLDEEYYAQGGALFFYNPAACSQEALTARESIQVKANMGLHYFYKVWE